MTVREACPGTGQTDWKQPVQLACFALVFAQATYLAAAYWFGSWLGAIPTDFASVWAAGRLVLQGQPEAAYDWPIHKQIEALAVGHPFDGYFGWHYPPSFLLVAAALALLPFTAAYGLWLAGTFPLYLGAIRAIVGERSGYVLAAAFPAVLSNFMVGQNGFLSAALLGGGLVLLADGPILAGFCFGLLTFKPQLGLLIPIALIAGGYWRTFITAGIVALLMAAASWGAFGTTTWAAFDANIGHTGQAFLSDGWADFGKLQTAFGLTRMLGGSVSLAWVIQIALALVAAAAIAALWRSRAAFELKAAALGAATLLATPYLYTYDLVVLAVPLAFLFRLGRLGGFLPGELSGIGVACLLILIFPAVKAPVGFAAVLIVSALVVRRAWRPYGNHVAMQ